MCVCGFSHRVRRESADVHAKTGRKKNGVYRGAIAVHGKKVVLSLILLFFVLSLMVLIFVLSLMVLILVLSLMVLIFVLSLMVLIFVLSLMVLILVLSRMVLICVVSLLVMIFVLSFFWSQAQRRPRLNPTSKFLKPGDGSPAHGTVAIDAQWNGCHLWSVLPMAHPLLLERELLGFRVQPGSVASAVSRTWTRPPHHFLQVCEDARM